MAKAEKEKLALDQKKIKAIDMNLAIGKRQDKIAELQEELKPEMVAYQKLMREIIAESR